eukprot:m.9594 g.9594  ORF g.9594 m.9594 type:complete len:131 (+) comp5444_c0_seq2:26-418(+)
MFSLKEARVRADELLRAAAQAQIDLFAVAKVNPLAQVRDELHIQSDALTIDILAAQTTKVCEGLLRLTNELKTQLIITDVASINAWRQARIQDLQETQESGRQVLESVLDDLNQTLSLSDQVLAQTEQQS